MNRRTFIGSALFAPAFGLAQKPHPMLKVSLNAYSFNQRLNDSMEGRAGGITLLQLVDWTAQNKFDAIDATGYYFPGYPEVPSDSYIASLKKKAADLGLAISGTGVRNNFTPADKSVREAGVKLVKAWIEVAAKLGAPVIRVFADTQGGKKWQDVAPASRGSRCKNTPPPRYASAQTRARSTAFVSAFRIMPIFFRPGSNSYR